MISTHDEAEAGSDSRGEADFSSSSLTVAEFFGIGKKK